jgi:hypothetical protein
MFSNPGCGVNAGGRLSPHAEGDADDFVADVVEEGYAREERGGSPQRSSPVEELADIAASHATVS